MCRTLPMTLATIGIAVIFTVSASAGTLSKGFIFKTDVLLEIGLEVTEDLVLDTIRFKVPEGGRGRKFLPSSWAKASRVPTVEVALSNHGDLSSRVGIAVSVYDEKGLLVGVASGGSRMIPVRSAEQVTYVLAFEHVNSRIAGAASFHITVESR